jgi:hypothetical protein
MKIVFWQRKAWLGAIVLTWIVAFLVVGLAMLREPHTKRSQPEIQETRGKTIAQPNPFARLRMEREQKRDQQLELLERAGNREALSALAAQKRTEAELEGMLRTMGYQEAVVLIGSDEASVVVAAALQENEVARIGEVVARKTGFSLERITISEGSRLPNRGKSERSVE